METHIATLRKAVGLTQEELALRCDVTRQTIIALEAGRYNPSLLLAHKITRALKQQHIEDVFVLPR
jgi:putative transcriptional regulator